MEGIWGLESTNLNLNSGLTTYQLFTLSNLPDLSSFLSGNVTFIQLFIILLFIFTDMANTQKGACLINLCLFHTKAEFKIVRSAARIRQETEKRERETQDQNKHVTLRKEKVQTQFNWHQLQALCHCFLFFPQEWASIILFLQDDATWEMCVSEGQLTQTLKLSILKFTIRHFHTNCEIICSSSVKNTVGSLIGIALNLQILTTILILFNGLFKIDKISKRCFTLENTIGLNSLKKNPKSHTVGRFLTV